MTDNEILARWQFGCHCEIEIEGICVIDDGEPWNCVYAKRIKVKESCQYWQPIARTGITPDYLNDAAACDSLLDTLVENGYLFTLKYTGENRYRWWFEIGDAKEVIVAVKYNRATRREAIVAAVLEVAKRELEADESARLEVARKEAQATCRG